LFLLKIRTKIGRGQLKYSALVKTPYVSIKLFKSANLDKIKRNYGEKLFVSRPKSKKPRKRRVKTRNKK
jgi:RNA-binding protein